MYWARKSWVFPVNEKRAEPGNLEFFRWMKNVLSTEILSFSGERKTCRARKSWVFPVNEKRSLSEPEKLKISGRSTFEWIGKTQDFRVKHIWVNRKNSRIQCSAPRRTDKTESEQPKMQEKQKKTQVAQCICFPRTVKHFAGTKWLQGSFYSRKLPNFKVHWIMF